MNTSKKSKFIEFLGNHSSTLITVALVGGFFAVIYVPRMFNSPVDWFHSYLKECQYSFQTNLDIDKKCIALEKSFLEEKANIKIDYQASANFILAKYKYLRGDVVSALSYCEQSIPQWKILIPSMNTTSPEYGLNQAKDSLEQCELMQKKHSK